MTWRRKPNKSSSSQCLIPKMLSLSWFLHIPMQNRQLNNHCCRNSKLPLIFRFVNVSAELFASISTAKLCARFCVCFWCCFNFSVSVSTAHILCHPNNRETTQILYYLLHHKIVCSIAFRVRSFCSITFSISFALRIVAFMMFVPSVYLFANVNTRDKLCLNLPKCRYRAGDFPGLNETVRYIFCGIQNTYKSQRKQWNGQTRKN